MKISRNKVRKLIREVLTEMDKRERQFRAAQYAYDNMLPPEYEDMPSDAASADDIFDFAFEELIDMLIEDAIDEEVLQYDEERDVILDEKGTIVATYDSVGNLEYPDPAHITSILKNNFREDMYVDQYDEYMINQLENDRAQDYEDYMSSRYDDYDPY